MTNTKGILPKLEEDIRLLSVAIDCTRKAMYNNEKKGIPTLSTSPVLLRCDALIKQRHQKIVTLNSMRETYRKAKALLDLA